jgi:hypothetical protein
MQLSKPRSGYFRGRGTLVWVFKIGQWRCSAPFSLLEHHFGAAAGGRGIRWSGFVLHEIFGVDVKSCLAARY